MSFHGANGHAQAVGDLLVAQSRDHENRDLTLSGPDRQRPGHLRQRGGATALAGLGQPMRTDGGNVRGPPQVVFGISDGGLGGSVSRSEQVPHLLEPLGYLVGVVLLIVSGPGMSHVL